MSILFDAQPYIAFLRRQEFCTLDNKRIEEFVKEYIVNYCDNNDRARVSNLGKPDEQPIVTKYRLKGHEWGEFFELLDQGLYECISEEIPLPTDKLLSVEYHRGYVEILPITVVDRVTEEKVTHAEAIKKFEDWLVKSNQELSDSVPRKVFELIDQYRSNVGWIE